MQLSKFTDYALRTLMHLAASADHRLTTRQIAEMHDAKYNHLAKVTQWLVRENYVRAIRGRAGGLKLAVPPQDINIGTLIRQLEHPSDLVECMRADGGSCPLTPCCGLTRALELAQEAFFNALSDTTLADLSTADPMMLRLLSRLNTDELTAS